MIDVKTLNILTVTLNLPLTFPNKLPFAICNMSPKCVAWNETLTSQSEFRSKQQTWETNVDDELMLRALKSPASNEMTCK